MAEDTKQNVYLFAARREVRRTAEEAINDPEEYATLTRVYVYVAPTEEEAFRKLREEDDEDEQDSSSYMLVGVLEGVVELVPVTVYRYIGR